MAQKVSKRAVEQQLPLDLIRTAEVASIRLAQLSARCDVAPDALPNRKLRVQFATAATDMEGLDFRVRAEIVATAGTEDGPENAPVEIRAVYILRYRVPSSVTPTKRDLSLFAETSALLNIWPYWRQLVHETSLRMELPPILLPLYRVARPQSTGERQAPPKSSSSSPQ